MRTNELYWSGLIRLNNRLDNLDELECSYMYIKCTSVDVYTVNSALSSITDSCEFLCSE